MSFGQVQASDGHLIVTEFLVRPVEKIVQEQQAFMVTLPDGSVEQRIRTLNRSIKEIKNVAVNFPLSDNEISFSTTSGGKVDIATVRRLLANGKKPVALVRGSLESQSKSLKDNAFLRQVFHPELLVAYIAPGHPVDSDGYLRRADSRHGEHNQAIAEYGTAIALNPKNVWAYLGRSNRWYDMQQYGKAIADCDRATNIDPYYAQSWNHKAWRLATCPDPKFRNAQAAVEAAKKAVNLDNKDAFIQRTLAAAYAAAGDFDNAVRTQETVVKLDGNEDFRRNLVLFKSKQTFVDAPREQNVRIFMNAAGTRAFQGTFVDLQADMLTLRKLDGILFKIPLSKLSVGDREWARGQ